MSDHDKLNRRIAEAMGWTCFCRYDGRWLGKRPGDTTPGTEFMDKFHLDANAAWNAAVEIVGVAWSLNSEPGGVIFAEIDEVDHPLGGQSWYADTAELALTAMCEAVLDAKGADA